MKYTCIACEFKYHADDMDVDERMCYNCLEESKVHEKIIRILDRCNLYDLRTIQEALYEMGFREKTMRNWKKMKESLQGKPNKEEKSYE